MSKSKHRRRWTLESRRPAFFPFPIDRELVWVCIGTDRSTGDSLGPFVGNMLTEAGAPNVYGTLDHPVHALNLTETLERIEVDHPDACIISIDACLGKAKAIGSMELRDGALEPGAGVGKVLPSVGDYNIIGVVNIGGSIGYVMLRNTRLSLVIRMAKIKLAPLKKPEETKSSNRPLPPFKLEYVVINGDKRPLHKFGEVECFSLAEVADEANLAIKSPAPFSNFDFDDGDEADIMLQIIEDLNLKCRVMQTDRGIHVWFRTPNGTGSPTKRRNALGLTQDIRGWDVNSLSTVKLNGKWREWIRDIPWEEVEEAPVWLKIIQPTFTAV